MKGLGFTLVLAVAGSLVPWGTPALARKPVASPCAGPYLVSDGTPLITGDPAPAVDGVVLSAAGVMIRSGCPVAPATAWPIKKGWKMRARWAVCGGGGSVLRNVRLKARMSGDCEVLKGRLMVGKANKLLRAFTAAPSRCGDGVVDRDSGERCEPPNAGTCDAQCRRTYPIPPRCGDGHLDPDEECDDGNTVDGDGCTDCHLPRCGDGVRDPGEQCDDGNDVDTDACNNRCEETCVGQATFDMIQQRVFTPSCALSGCHGAFTQANLDLRAGAAHVSLVDVLADNATARAAGKRRVVPGNPAASFLSQKLHGLLADGEGGPMPLSGTPLSDRKLDAIDAWIRAGAEATGVAPDAPCLTAQAYEPAAPLPPPPGGYQLVLDGPTLQPGEEQEGCLWVPVPNPTDFAVSKFEFSLNPGTHHFALFEYIQPGAPETGVWHANDFGCFSGAPFGGAISGAPQAPYFRDIYPPGIARLIKAGGYIGLNAHYHNDFDVPIQIKVWSNLYPYEGTPEHIVQTLQDLSTTFSIDIPAFTQQVHHGHFVNTHEPMTFIGVSGHMHYRGLRFTIWKSDGTKVYENFDWGHPGGAGFDPPFVLMPNDYFDYECLYDNGVTRPVRRDTSGNPTNLVFGVTTEDAMCILVGVYY